MTLVPSPPNDDAALLPHQHGLVPSPAYAVSPLPDLEHRSPLPCPRATGSVAHTDEEAHRPLIRPRMAGWMLPSTDLVARSDLVLWRRDPLLEALWRMHDVHGWRLDRPSPMPSAPRPAAA